MAVRNRDVFRPHEFRTALDSAEGLNLLQSLLRKLQDQEQMEGSAGDVSLHLDRAGLPSEFQEQVDKEHVVRRLIQRLREDS